MKPDDQFLPIRKSDQIQRFLTDFYSETDIEPGDVEYVEANGAGKRFVYSCCIIIYTVCSSQ